MHLLNLFWIRMSIFEEYGAFNMKHKSYLFHLFPLKVLVHVSSFVKRDSYSGNQIVFFFLVKWSPFQKGEYNFYLSMISLTGVSNHFKVNGYTWYFFFLSFVVFFFFFVTRETLFVTFYLRSCPSNLVTLVLLNQNIPCLCKQCRSRSVGFWRSQMIWICTVCHSACDIMSIVWIK